MASSVTHTSTLLMLLGFLLVALGEVCIKEPPGVEPSPRAAVEKTQSFRSRDPQRRYFSCLVLSGEAGVAAAPGHHVWAELTV